ncbi:hypothetical protein BJ878DRAFT_541246 [Calycina marina]|uniref:2EXR domain-containing protein n=1 Tax=Calycina marina TaxID=1763456 RepID=A0A9P7Z4M2_9HELO|nr:hypothetical protein BJ878DRAFT_541246 [Calycina marina]
MSPLEKKFTKLSDLPSELQLKIWEAALPPPRIITITSFRPQYQCAKCGRVLPSASETCHLAVLTYKRPALIQVCSTSRRVFLQAFPNTITFETTPEVMKRPTLFDVRLNASSEVVFINHQNNLFGYWAFTGMPILMPDGIMDHYRNLADVKHVAVEPWGASLFIEWKTLGLLPDVTTISFILRSRKLALSSVSDIQVFDKMNADPTTSFHSLCDYFKIPYPYTAETRVDMSVNQESFTVLLNALVDIRGRYPGIVAQIMVPREHKLPRS